MRSEIMPWYLMLYLLGVFLGAVSQVLLKKAAQRPHRSFIEEYTDWRVILGYGIFIGCTVLSVFAYKGIPMSLGPVLEATSYIYITIFGVVIFHEKVGPKKVAALAIIVAGILIYTLLG